MSPLLLTVCVISESFWSSRKVSSSAVIVTVCGVNQLADVKVSVVAES